MNNVAPAVRAIPSELQKFKNPELNEKMARLWAYGGEFKYQQTDDRKIRFWSLQIHYQDLKSDNSKYIIRMRRCKLDKTIEVVVDGPVPLKSGYPFDTIPIGTYEIRRVRSYGGGYIKNWMRYVRKFKCSDETPEAYSQILGKILDYMCLESSAITGQATEKEHADLINQIIQNPVKGFNQLAKQKDTIPFLVRREICYIAGSLRAYQLYHMENSTCPGPRSRKDKTKCVWPENKNCILREYEFVYKHELSWKVPFTKKELLALKGVMEDRCAMLMNGTVEVVRSFHNGCEALSYRRLLVDSSCYKPSQDAFKVIYFLRKKKGIVHEISERNIGKKQTDYWNSSERKLYDSRRSRSRFGEIPYDETRRCNMRSCFYNSEDIANLGEYGRVVKVKFSGGDEVEYFYAGDHENDVHLLIHMDHYEKFLYFPAIFFKKRKQSKKNYIQLVHTLDVEASYDALFSCNKYMVGGFRKKTVTITDTGKRVLTPDQITELEQQN